MLEASLLGVGTVLRFERDAWSVAKRPSKQQMRILPPQMYLLEAGTVLGTVLETVLR